jgi:S1-C subfamily serine protease
MLYVRAEQNEAGEDGYVFAGTACAFRTGRHFLTARHCIGDLPDSGIVVVLPQADPPFVKQVCAVNRHPIADLAVLEITDDSPRVTPFLAVSAELSLGESFFAFGYPEDATLNPDTPPPRLFVGNIQRYFHHTDPLTTSNYLAGEMSMAAPRGLSGGPLFKRGLQAPPPLEGLMGIVTGNFDSSTAVEAHEEEDSSGQKRIVQYKRVISYGVALILRDFADWLDMAVPGGDKTKG